MNATIATAKAGAHPLRLTILTELQGKSLSPNRIAAKLDEPLGNVSYHVKTLLEFDMVQLDKTEPRRGAVEHYYSVTPAGERLLRSTDGSGDSEALDKIAVVLRGDDAIGDPSIDPSTELSEIDAIVKATGRDVG